MSKIIKPKTIKPVHNPDAMRLVNPFIKEKAITKVALQENLDRYIGSFAEYISENSVPGSSLMNETERQAERLLNYALENPGDFNWVNVSKGKQDGDDMPPPPSMEGVVLTKDNVWKYSGVVYHTPEQLLLGLIQHNNPGMELDKQLALVSQYIGTVRPAILSIRRVFKTDAPVPADPGRVIIHAEFDGDLYPALYESSLMIITGLQGLGKTTFTLDLAMNEVDFLQLAEGEKISVLDFENDEMTQARMVPKKFYKAGHTYRVFDRDHTYEVSLAPASYMEEIIAAAPNPVVVLEGVSMLFGSGMDEEVLRAFYIELLKIGNKHRKTILTVQHAARSGKADEVTGINGSIVMRIARLMIAFTRGEDTPSNASKIEIKKHSAGGLAGRSFFMVFETSITNGVIETTITYEKATQEYKDKKSFIAGLLTTPRTMVEIVTAAIESKLYKEEESARRRLRPELKKYALPKEYNGKSNSKTYVLNPAEYIKQNPK